MKFYLSSLAVLLLTSQVQAAKLNFIFEEDEVIEMEKVKKEEKIKMEKQEKEQKRIGELVSLIEEENNKPIQPFFQGSYASVPLKNINNQQYTGSLWFGKPA